MGKSVALLAAKRMPGTVIAVIGVDTLQNAELKLPEEMRKSILDGVEKDFKETVRVTIAGLLPEKADAELKTWLQTNTEGQDPKMALALMRGLFGLDTRKLFKEAKVPARCLNSPADTSSSPPRPSRPTKSTPTSGRSPSTASATTRCWRSRTNSIANSGTCSRSRDQEVSPPRPAGVAAKKPCCPEKAVIVTWLRFSRRARQGRAES